MEEVQPFIVLLSLCKIETISKCS